MADEHRRIFQPGADYSATREIRAGFKSDIIVPVGSKLKYVELKYSPYDGCYVYYFQPSAPAEVIEVWFPEDTSPQEIRTLLPLCT